jgi:RimJ/RimL family protein N-acetyltransferase
MISLNISFKQVRLDDINVELKKHLRSLPSAIDSFLEDHVLESIHYNILVSNIEAGFTSIHQGSLVTQFYLTPEYRCYGQSIFAQIKKLAQVQAAFVATCDEFFLSHALDDYRQFAKQAYFFATPSELPDVSHLPYTLRQAIESDIEGIQHHSGDFFGDKDGIESKVKNQELFLTFSAKNCVGFGIIEKSTLLDKTASIGMFVIESHRQQGTGTAIIQLLMKVCEEKGLRPVAGCWYYNHLSKKTLERAGMFSQTRLLKVDF